jgi:hypothetical protein
MRNLARNVRKDCLQVPHTVGFFNMRPTALLPLIVIALNNPSYSAGFELAKLGSNGKHNNHYTAEGDNIPATAVLLPSPSQSKLPSSVI